MSVFLKQGYFVLVICTCSLLSGCLMPESIREHQKFIAEQVKTNPDIQTNFIENDEFKLHYKSNGKAIKAVAVWIHGTPGGWSDIGRLLVDDEFLSEVLLVSIDRPGWGQSQFVGSLDFPKVIPEFSEQARLIEPLLSKLKEEYVSVPIILVGHSWGGSLAPYLGVEYPKLIDGIIVLAGGLDPDLVKPRWYNKAGKLVYGTLSYAMKAANDEVYVLVPELTAMADRWDEINVPVIVVQGDKDGLVDPDNANYAEEKLDPDNSWVLSLQGQGHLLQIERSNLIAKCITAMADGSLDDCK